MCSLLVMLNIKAATEVSSEQIKFAVFLRVLKTMELGINFNIRGKPINKHIEVNEL